MGVWGGWPCAIVTARVSRAALRPPSAPAPPPDRSPKRARAVVFVESSAPGAPRPAGCARRGGTRACSSAAGMPSERGVCRRWARVSRPTLSCAMPILCPQGYVSDLRAENTALKARCLEMEAAHPAPPPVRRVLKMPVLATGLSEELMKLGTALVHASAATRFSRASLSDEVILCAPPRVWARITRVCVCVHEGV